jgi:hypothetical protein
MRWPRHWALDAGGNGCEVGATLRDGVAKLSSRNFGYEFALVHVDAGTGIFGTNEYAVRIYISCMHRDEYTFLRTTRNLGGAVRVIEQMYRRAAQQHLP